MRADAARAVHGAGADGIPNLRLDNAFARALPELSVPWQAMRPEDPAILELNEPLAAELGLDPETLRTEAGMRALLGNELPPGATPVAQAYAGHQFGGYSPRLGDGRALLLGEVVDGAGVLRDLHLKGSGPTPFARADGFAAVGPMLREYLMGEAMHALGIPTTRALAVIGTGQLLARDESFDLLPGAVLVRVASSHVRVGSFQYARGLGLREGGSDEPIRRLADFAIARHHPQLAAHDTPYLGLLEAVITAQARLVAAWMLIGFVHGVMNTDNMTISGETIDYGPCAFIDAYDPGAVFSSIDRGGRYAYGRQPAIALWNLTRFAEELLPLLGDDFEGAKAAAEQALRGFAAHYDEAWVSGMAAKLGLAQGSDAPPGRVPVDTHVVVELASGLQQELQAHGIDYTVAFRALAAAARGDEGEYRSLLPAGTDPGEWFDSWIGLAPDGDAMDAVNPLIIPRNHLVEAALAAATTGDLVPFERLLEAVADPFTARPGFERYTLPAPGGLGGYVTYCGT